MKKKKLLSMLSMVATVVSLLGSPYSTYAETFKADAYGDTDTDPQILYDDTDAELSTDSWGATEQGVTVTSEGTDKKITYSVTVTFGEMSFVYDYGMKWDPGKHMYVQSPNGGTSIAASWDKSKFDGINNKINIVNDSNYPVNAKITYDMKSGIFNTNAQLDTSVVGFFSTDNSKIINALAYDGYGATQGDSNTIGKDNASGKDVYLKADSDIDIKKASGLTSQAGAIYGELKSGDNKGKNSVDFYFGLCGKPDRGRTYNSDDAGKIKVKISPSSSDKVDLRPLVLP